MDFIKYKCPVCDKQFAKDDDIVVCPECGAPHHRECYEKENHCFFEDKHKDGFSFEDDNTESENNDNTDNSNTVICKVCQTENPKELFYCQKCGAPLNECDQRANANTGNGNYQQPNGNPFSMPFGGAQQMVNPFDPMAGFKNNEPIAENITAGEMSRFTGKNTQYFLRVFNNITKFNRSRFNFSAFIFSGMYFLYRKMIALGCIFSLLLIGLTVGEAYIQMLPSYQNAYTSLMTAMNSGQYVTLFSIPGVSDQDVLLALLPGVLSLVKMAVMIVSGAIANRCYYKHSIKKITSIKQNAPDGSLNKALEAKGGVNLPLAVCIGAAYIITTYIPLFI